MASVAVVAASEGGQCGILEHLAGTPTVGHMAVVGRSDEKLSTSGIDQLRTQSMRSAAAVAEILRWFESKPASHLLFIFSPRVELSHAGLHRLLQVAVDSGSALL